MPSIFWFDLGQVDWAFALFPLATLFKEVDTLETLEDATLSANGSARSFETAMLRHGVKYGLGDVWSGDPRQAGLFCKFNTRFFAFIAEPAVSRTLEALRKSATRP